MSARHMVVLVILLCAVGDCVPHRLPSKLVGEVAQVRRVKELPLVKRWKLYDCAGEFVGLMGLDMLGGRWYKPVGAWRDGRKTWRTGEGVDIPHAQEVEVE